VVIIGGSSGIGLAVAQQTARLGARVIIVSRLPQKLEAATAKIRSDVTAIPADVLDEAPVADLFRSTGTVDHLVVTAVADEIVARTRPSGSL
jgi:NAD(P)-dependent dehydrogenase (short-subunit alcohol dehydrogenase family)